MNFAEGLLGRFFWSFKASKIPEFNQCFLKMQKSCPESLNMNLFGFGYKLVSEGSIERIDEYDFYSFEKLRTNEKLLSCQKKTILSESWIKEDSISKIIEEITLFEQNSI